MSANPYSDGHKPIFSTPEWSIPTCPSSFSGPLGCNTEPLSPTTVPYFTARITADGRVDTDIDVLTGAPLSAATGDHLPGSLAIQASDDTVLHLPPMRLAADRSPCKFGCAQCPSAQALEAATTLAWPPAAPSAGAAQPALALTLYHDGGGGGSALRRASSIRLAQKPETSRAQQQRRLRDSRCSIKHLLSPACSAATRQASVAAAVEARKSVVLAQGGDVAMAEREQWEQQVNVSDIEDVTRDRRAMSTIAEIHAACVDATRRYLHSRLLSSYMRSPETSSPYTYMRYSAAPSSAERPSAYSIRQDMLRQHHQVRRASIRRRQSPHAASSPAAAADAPEYISHNLSTNISLICSHAWQQACQTRLYEARSETLAVGAMEMLLRWSESIINAKQTLNRAREALQYQYSAGPQEAGFEDAVRDVEASVVRGVAAAAENICTYMEDGRAKRAIGALSLGF